MVMISCVNFSLKDGIWKFFSFYWLIDDKILILGFESNGFLKVEVKNCESFCVNWDFRIFFFF